MALIFIGKVCLPCISLLAGEHFFLREKLAALYEDSSIKGVPRAFGAVLLVNVVASGMFITLLGMGVGGSRSTYKEKAVSFDSANHTTYNIYSNAIPRTQYPTPYTIHHTPYTIR
jgi:hypothetical protein